MEDNPFLRGLTPEQHDLFSALFVPAHLARGQTIFRQGDSAAYMYLLMDGDVSILYKPYDGPRITLTALHVGDVFGWSSVVGTVTLGPWTQMVPQCRKCCTWPRRASTR